MPVMFATALLVLATFFGFVARGRSPMLSFFALVPFSVVAMWTKGESVATALLQISASVLIVVQTYLALGPSRNEILRQFRIELGLLALTTLAMISSMFMPPASANEKRLVMISAYSAVLLLATGAVHLPLFVLRLRRDVNRGSTQA